MKALQSNLRGLRIPRHLTIPQDERLRQMLDSGTYVCERLEHRSHTAVKQLALAVAEQLVNRNRRASFFALSCCSPGQEYGLGSDHEIDDLVIRS